MKNIKVCVKNLIFVIFILIIANSVYAITFSEPWEEIEYYKNNENIDAYSHDPMELYYKDGVPDVTDGDLEDKLGDLDLYNDEFENDYKDEIKESKVIRQPLNRTEADRKDVSSFITYRLNGETVVPVMPEKVNAYNPEEVPYLKQLVQTYGEDVLTTLIIYWDGKQCRYNKENKLFMVIE